MQNKSKNYLYIWLNNVCNSVVTIDQISSAYRLLKIAKNSKNKALKINEKQYQSLYSVLDYKARNGFNNFWSM